MVSSGWFFVTCSQKHPEHLSQHSWILCGSHRDCENSLLATNPKSESHSSWVPNISLPWESPAETPRQLLVTTGPRNIPKVVLSFPVLEDGTYCLEPQVADTRGGASQAALHLGH